MQAWAGIMGLWYYRRLQMPRWKNVMRAQGFGHIFRLLSLLLPTLAWGQTAVTVQSFAQLAIHPEGSAPATVVSLNDSPIAAEISAPIVTVTARVGDVVAAGAELARLDCRDFEASEQQAEASVEALAARLALARYQLSRTQSLVRGNTVSEESLKQREAEAKALAAEQRAAEATLTRTRHDRERCILRAPFRAVVAERMAGIGSYAVPGQALFRLVDLDRIEVSAQVPATDLPLLLNVTDYSFLADKVRSSLALRTVAPVVETRSRTVEVRLESTVGSLLPGSAGRLVWRDPRSFLPAEYLLRREGRYGVFVAEEGRARFIPVDQVAEGRPAPATLPAEAQVVVEGRFALQDGDAITVQK